ncbi:cytochrome P450 [Lyophyllum atratum]|nr:cytochrome P450 [Lyophyllum atratum]
MHLLPPPLTLQLAAAALFTVFISLILRRRSTRIKALPPSPPGTFFFGNALQISKQTPWIKFTEWATIYGDVVLAKVFSRKLVIINSYELAMRLFESTQYSDRPRRRMVELSGFDQTILFMPYGEEVRRGRKLMRKEMNTSSLQAYHATHVKEAHAFAKKLLDDPTGFLRHIQNALSGSLLHFTYDHRVESEHDSLMALAREAVAIAGQLISPNRYAVDIFPTLRFLPEGWPGTAFKRTARSNRDLHDRLMDTPFLKVREQAMNGMAEPSFTANHLNGKVETMSQADLDTLKFTAGVINGGQFDISSVLSTFFLLMARHPDIQAKAQQEIDSVLDSGTLPTFADRERLPFIECIIKEVFRWHPPTPLISRAVRGDDIVKDYFIPSGTYILANVWAFTHDPNVYPEPFEFKPERFLPNHSKLSQSLPPDPRLYVFGFGRRGCPGSELANNMIFIMLVTTLALFKILPAEDKDGNPILPEPNYTPTLISQPLPFECKIVPRSCEAIDLLIYASEA